MRYRFALFVSYAFFIAWHTLASAQDDYAAIAREAVRMAPLQTAQYRAEAIQLSAKANQMSKSYAVEQNKVGSSNSQSQSSDDKKSLNTVLVFVSFSMPRASLVAYLHEAKKAHASVVIRGLINNSFKETFKTVAELVKESNGGGVELNPIAFDRFHITQVPTVVVANGNDCFNKSSCDINRDYDLLSGNIGLQAALMQIRNHGKVASHKAGEALNQLVGGANV